MLYYCKTTFQDTGYIWQIKATIGYALEVRVDSVVLILSNGLFIILSEVLQMVGRSSRNQGTLRGSIIMLDNNFLGKDQAWSKIKTRGAAKDGTYFPKLELMYSIEKDATELDVKMTKTM